MLFWIIHSSQCFSGAVAPPSVQTRRLADRGVRPNVNRQLKHRTWQISSAEVHRTLSWYGTFMNFFFSRNLRTSSPIIKNSSTLQIFTELLCRGVYCFYSTQGGCTTVCRKCANIGRILRQCHIYQSTPIATANMLVRTKTIT